MDQSGKTERLFLSLVGYQFMATCNPFLVLWEKVKEAEGQNGLRVVLYATPGKSSDFAHRLKSFLGGKIAVEVVEISSTLVPDQGLPTVVGALEQTLAAYPEAEIFFNVAGGLGFQVAACIRYLYVCRCPVHYLYPERYSVRHYRPRGPAPEPLDLETLEIPTLKISQIFKLQGLNYQPGSNDLNQQLEQLLSALISLPLPRLPAAWRKMRQTWINAGSKKPPPAVNLLPRKVWKNVTIGSCRFDIVFNQANTLHFLKVVPRGTDVQLQREIIATVADRRNFGELFHHRILVLTNYHRIAERLRTEGAGKIEVGRYGSSRLLQKLAPRLEAFLDPQPAPPGNTLNPKPLPPADDRVLYLFLARPPLSTLKAILSHPRIGRVGIFYTPDDSRVNFFKQQLADRQKQQSLQCPPLTFIPVSYSARELEDFRPAGEFEVDVTPGTKEQRFFLARMAARHDGTIYSVDNNQGLMPLYGSEPVAKKVIAPPPEAWLPLVVDSSAIDFTVGNWSPGGDLAMESLLALFRALGGQIKKFFEDDITWHNNGVKLQRRKKNFTVWWQGKDFTFTIRPNNWFERLTGYAISRAVPGARVLLSVKTRWLLQDPAYPDSFRSESDLLVQVSDRYYLVSCKAGKMVALSSNKRQEQLKAAREIRSNALALDRMTIPLLAVLGCAGPPREVAGVFRFGYETLIDANALEKLFADAVAAVSTTRAPAPAASAGPGRRSPAQVP